MSIASEDDSSNASGFIPAFSLLGASRSTPSRCFVGGRKFSVAFVDKVIFAVCFDTLVSEALFRALKTKKNTPKYGLIYHDVFGRPVGAKPQGKDLSCACSQAVPVRAVGRFGW